MLLMRSYSRPVAWLMLGILVWHFWSPREGQELHLAGKPQQIARTASHPAAPMIITVYTLRTAATRWFGRRISRCI